MTPAPAPTPKPNPIPTPSPTPAAKTVDMHRMYNPNAVVGTHNYTASKAENDHLASLGWHAEGVGWYGVKST